MADEGLTQATKQNLNDACCDKKLIEHFLALERQNKKKEQVTLLSKHRKALLRQVHDVQKALDCLDYLLYDLKKQL